MESDFIKWFAGFFDGEGSISIHLLQTHTGLVFQPKLQIAQKEVSVLERIKKEFQIPNKIQTTKIIPIGKYIPKMPVNLLVISNRMDCLKISKAILPYSIVKKQLLKKFIEFLELMGKKWERKNKKLLYDKMLEFNPNVNDTFKQRLAKYIL